MSKQSPILAVCGKGGVGKTAFSALLARVFLEQETKPLLLIDADPAGGLVSAIGEGNTTTLADVRERLIASARQANDTRKTELAHQLDYMVMEALLERDDYALLAMGRSEEKGCYCPVNTLLRDAIDLLAAPFAAVLIDAEAGLEQIQRQVTRNVSHVVAISDGSQRGDDTIGYIAELVGMDRLFVVANRCDLDDLNIEKTIKILGALPEDEDLKIFDRKGKPLWDLPADNPALAALREIATGLTIIS